ncbi:MAG: VWA domain-containing protein [Acidobacteriota bacterium]
MRFRDRRWSFGDPRDWLSCQQALPARQRIAEALGVLALAGVLALVGWSSAAAQQGEQSQADSQALGAGTPFADLFQDSADVNVVNLEVQVTDGEGQPVSGLGLEDFVLLEDGEPVEITNFYAVENGEVLLPAPVSAAEGEATAAPEAAAEESGAEPPPRQLTIALFVDNTFISPTGRSRVFSKVREFLLDAFQPGTRILLAANERELVIRQPLTEVPFDIYYTLDAMERDGSPEATSFEIQHRGILREIGELNIDQASGFFATTGANADLPQEFLTQQVVSEIQGLVPRIRSYSQQVHVRAKDSLDVLDRFVRSIAGMPGTKAVIHVSDGIPMRAGEDLFEALNLRVEQLPSQQSLLSLQDEASRYDLSEELQNMAAAANRDRVSFYTLYAAPPAAALRGAAENRGSLLNNASLGNLAEANAQASLSLLAEQTGGTTANDATDFLSTLETIYRDFNHHYALGYVAPRRGGAAGARNLEVRLVEAAERRGWSLRHRSSVRDKSAAERMAERTYTTLALGAVDNPLGVGVSPQTIEEEGGTLEGDGEDEALFVVPLLVQVPLGNVVLVPGAAHHEGRVSVYLAVGDELGRLSPVTRHVCPIRIPNEELLTALGRTAACGLRLLMRGGPQKVAVTVHDELGARESAIQLELDVAVEEAASAPADAPVPGR